MDPTDEEQLKFLTINDVATWAALEGDPGEEESPRGSLFRALGVSGAEHPRTIAAIRDVDYDAIVGAWQVGGHPPSPAQLGQAWLIAHGSRVKCAVQKTDARGDAACWSEGFSRAVCCGSESGPRGNLACWDAFFTFERCCGTRGTTDLEAPPPSDSAGIQIRQAPTLFEGILAANSRGPNGEELSLVPSHYVFALLMLLIFLLAFAQLFRYMRHCCCGNATRGKISVAETIIQRARRLQRFRDKDLSEQFSFSGHRRVGID